MQTITFAASKGGAGKSTLAIGIASLLHSRGKRVMVLDLDEQGSLATWLDDDKNELQLPDPKLLTIEALELPDDDAEKISTVVKRLVEIEQSKQYDYLLIDTKGEQARLTAAIGAYSDYVLCPTNGHSIEFEPVVKVYLGLKQIIEELETDAEPDKLFHVVITKRKTVEAGDILAAQGSLRKSFTTINGPMESSSFNKAHEYGTTIDLLAQAAEQVGKTTTNASERARAGREFRRHTKALAVLCEMMDELEQGAGK